MILKRLKQAILEQNWFAVGLEVVIVVLGVVIGFQITAWANRQADLSTERSYLNQIRQDVEETRNHATAVGGFLAESELAAGHLFDSFRSIEPLSDDSIQILISKSLAYYPVYPVLGTIEALMSTGDLSLIRDDSLRMFIPVFVEQVRLMSQLQEEIQAEMRGAMMDLTGMVDVAQANALERKAGGVLEVPAPQIRTSDPAYSTDELFPFSASEFRRSFEAYNAVYRIHHWKLQAKASREGLIAASQDLLSRMK